jgi:hypothetical protein
MINFSWWMEMRFQKVNNRRFKGFRVSIIMGHENSQHLHFGTRLYFLFLDFWKCQCTLLGALTCRPDFIIISKNEHFIQIVYLFWDYSNFVTTHLKTFGDDFILLLSKQVFDDCFHVGLVQFVLIPSKLKYFGFIETTNVDFVD